MKDDRKTTGRRGEDEACAFLIKEGHTILERNFRSSHQEADIISADSAGLHFVEVKTRNAPTSAEPESNVDRAKMKNMVKTARSYLHSCNRPQMADMEIFFDVVTVVLEGEKVTLEYYPQAFIPTYV